MDDDNLTFSVTAATDYNRCVCHIIKSLLEIELVLVEWVVQKEFDIFMRWHKQKGIDKCLIESRICTVQGLRTSREMRSKVRVRKWHSYVIIGSAATLGCRAHLMHRNVFLLMSLSSDNVVENYKPAFINDKSVHYTLVLHRKLETVPSLNKSTEIEVWDNAAAFIRHSDKSVTMTSRFAFSFFSAKYVQTICLISNTKHRHQR